MFSQVSVCPQGACMAGGRVWQEGVYGRGVHAWQGACMAGGVHGRGHAWQGGLEWWGTCMVGGAWIAGGVCGGRHAWQERRPLQRAVRITLECILVINVSAGPFTTYSRNITSHGWVFKVCSQQATPSQTLRSRAEWVCKPFCPSQCPSKRSKVPPVKVAATVMESLNVNRPLD